APRARRRPASITPARKLLKALLEENESETPRRRLLMPVQLPDARHLTDEALQVLRLRALRGLELGYSEVELADLLGVRHETISRWWTAYQAEGLPALPGGRTGRPPGSGRLLSEEQAEHIRGRIDNHSPGKL